MERKEEKKVDGDPRVAIINDFARQLETIAPRQYQSLHVDEEEKEEFDPDREMNDSVNFCVAMAAAHNVFEEHIIGNPTTPLAITTLPTADQYMRYWMRAPSHHWQAGSGKASDNPTIHEMVWLTRAYAHACEEPHIYNVGVCADATIMEMASTMKKIRKEWCTTPLSDYDGYRRTRTLFVSTLVFMISEGIKSLIDRRAIPASVQLQVEEGKTEIKFEAPPPNIDRDTQLGITIPVPRLTTEKLQEDMRAFDASAIVADWLPVCSRVFSYIDACTWLMDHYPVIDLAPLPDHKTTMMAYRRWTIRQVQNKMPEEFKRGLLACACRLALPIGTMDAYMRNPGAATVSSFGLYQSEYEEEESERFKKLTVDTLSRDHYGRERAPGREGFIRDAVILWTYHHGFGVKVSSLDWMKRYFVDSCDLRGSMLRIVTNNENGETRRPMVIQIADSFYVHNNKNLIRTRDIEEALWYWTYLMAKEFNATLADGHDISSRWLDILFSAT